MKKKIFSLILTISCLNINAADLFVYPGASSPDFSSIATAVDSANDGDRVLVSNGSYFGDINIIAKSISILPVISSNSITIQGNIIVNTDSSVSPKNITISSVYIIGDFKHEGLNYLILTPYEINIINCTVIGEFNLNADNIITNIYYSTFYKSVYLNASLEIVGNTFESTSSGIDTISVLNGLWSNGSTLQSSEVKVFANRFNNFQLRCDLTSGNIFSNIHIANNYFTSNLTGSGKSMLFLNGSTTSCLIENNTFYDQQMNGSYSNGGDILNSPNGLALLTIRNNIFLFHNNWSNNYYLFTFYPNGRNTVLKMEHNFVNQTTYSVDGVLTSSYYGAYFYYTPYSTIVNNNIYDNSFNIQSSPPTLVINDTSGVPSAGVLTLTENAGKNIIECRDIDDTQNDVGTWGGPHSWTNYHQNSVGTARVIDIDINSSINSITNGSLNIKAKSVNTNQ